VGGEKDYERKNVRRSKLPPASPEERERLERRLMELYNERQQLLMRARARGPLWYVARVVRRLTPILSIPLFLGGILLGLRESRRIQLAAATHMPWVVATAFGSIVVAVALAVAIGTAAWFHAKSRLFPYLEEKDDTR
jgi:hypothetical protein